METLSPTEPFRFTPEFAPPAPAAGSAGNWVRETRREIGVLVREAGELARGDAPPEVFWPAFLDRVVRAMAADGAVAWRIEPQEIAALARAGRLTDATLELEQGRANLRMLREIAGGEAPVLVPPTPPESGEAGNRTESLAAVVPIRCGDQVTHALQVYLSNDGGPATQRGYLRFAAQMGDLAGEFVRASTLRRLHHEAEQWRRWMHLSADLHASLRWQEAIQRTAEAGRRLPHIERASVVAVSGRRVRLVATAGCTDFDPRSPEVRRIEAAAGRALGGPVWGDAMVEREGDGPPQPGALRAVACVPIREPSRGGRLRPIREYRAEDSTGSVAEPEEVDPATVLAILVLESHRVEAPERAVREAATMLARHAGASLAASARVSRVPLLGALAQAGGPARGPGPRRRIMGGVLLVATLAVLGLIPVPLRVDAPATLEPVDIQRVYAPRGGLVSEVAVRHGEAVDAGEVLVRMVDRDLDAQLEQLLGQQEFLSERLREVSRSLVRQATLAARDRESLEADQQQLQGQLEMAGRQLEMVRRQREALVLRSDRAGVVDAWEADRRLAGSTARPGALLMRIVVPQGAWMARTEIPQQRLDHVLGALERHQLGVPVTAMLRAFPGEPIPGRLERLGPAVRSGSEHQPVALAEIPLEASRLPMRQAGAQVSVSIPCGSRPLVYVVFQDLIRSLTAWGRLWLTSS